jgi:hypothetical protein
VRKLVEIKGRKSDKADLGEDQGADRRGWGRHSSLVRKCSLGERERENRELGQKTAIFIVTAVRTSSHIYS